MTKRLLFAVVVISMLVNLFAAALIVPMQLSQQIEAADPTPTSLPTPSSNISLIPIPPSLPVTDSISSITVPSTLTYNGSFSYNVSLFVLKDIREIRSNSNGQVVATNITLTDAEVSNIHTLANRTAADMTRWSDGYFTVNFNVIEIDYVDNMTASPWGTYWLGPWDVKGIIYDKIPANTNFIIVTHSAENFPLLYGGGTFGADSNFVGLGGRGYSWCPWFRSSQSASSTHELYHQIESALILGGTTFLQESYFAPDDSPDWCDWWHSNITSIDPYSYSPSDWAQHDPLFIQNCSYWGNFGGYCNYICANTGDCRGIDIFNQFMFETHFPRNIELVTSHCCDGIQNYGETSVDKGGNDCPKATTLSITVNPIEGGNASAIYDCCSPVVGINAIVKSGYRFVNWTGSGVDAGKVDNPNSASTTILMDADYSITANFAIDTFTLTYNASANGNISGTTPQTVDCGSNGSAVTAIPDPCYYFVNWSDASTDNPRTDTSVNGNINVTANFAPTGATYTLTINSSEYGNVSTPGEGAFGPYNCGDVIDLIAEADTDYAFHNWEGDIETIGNNKSSITTITMYDDYSITANFGLPPTGFHGDADQDGELSIGDYAFLRLMLFNKQPFNPGGDADQDGLLSIGDYAFLRLMLFGKQPIVDKYEVTYDFISGADSNKWAKSKTVSSVPPADHFDNDSGWTDATTGNYDDISLNDSNVWTITGTPGNYSALQCKFTVLETAANITSIGITLNGSAETAGDTLQLWAWNFTTGSWTQIGRNFSMTTSIASYSSWTAWGKVYSNYIDSNGYMYILANLTNAGEDLFVDYIKLTVAHP